MSVSHGPEDTRQIPTRREAFIFRFKSSLLKIRRRFKDARGDKVRKHEPGAALIGWPVIAESKTLLWTETGLEERFLVAGKIQNLRLAVSEIDSVEIPAGEVFSFWKNVGRTTRGRGFVPGRELREGCIIPNIGGGLCQLSNALYDAALKANFEIVERHAHTRVIAGSLAEQGRDATVFWNYVDLRFRSPSAFRIETNLTGEHLAIKFRGTRVENPVLHQILRAPAKNGDVNSCASCGMDDCFRSLKPIVDLDFGKTAFLVDEFVPEFDEYIRSTRSAKDELFLPIDGKRYKKTNYAWATDGFSRVNQSRYVTAVRSFRSRRLAAQGAARQKNLLAMYERLAASYSRRLRFDVLHVVVQQNLLPFLWRSGQLRGRTFDVLMTGLPLAELQSRLDVAHQLNPASKTLGDFRADAKLLADESEALKRARRIITSHTDIASLFPDKAELSPWKMPDPAPVEKQKNEKPVIIFPASTVGRKGCYELREAIRGLDVRLVTLGPYIEVADFWDGFDVVRGSDDWLATADIVVLPAFVEHRPRRLLLAAAAGIPVIASSACGVENVSGIETIIAGDAAALRDRIERITNSDKSTETFKGRPEPAAAATY